MLGVPSHSKTQGKKRPARTPQKARRRLIQTLANKYEN
jgi:hypothetical protein